MISLFEDAKKAHEAINEEKKIAGLPITREDAIKLINSFDQDAYDKTHYLMSEAVVSKVAEKLGEDKNYFAMVGLLHDIDWALTKENPQTHLTKAREILEQAGFDDEFISLVISHGYGFDCAGLQDKKRTEKKQFILAAGETLTGLIYTYALMREGKVSDMEVKGLKKKFKDKAFAAKVDRNVIREIEQTGMTLDEFFAIGIAAIKDIRGTIGLL